MPRSRRFAVLAVVALTGGVLTAVVGVDPATAAPAVGTTASPAAPAAPFVPASGLPRPGTPADPVDPGATTARAAVPATASVAARPTAAGTFTAVPPARLLDTRDGTGAAAAKVTPGGTVTVRVAGRGGVPAAGAGAVVLTLTATSVTSDGFLTAYPAGRSRPVVSDLNLRPGVTVANLVTVPLGADGSVALYSGAGAPVDLVADVSGWYRSGTTTAAGAFTAVPPARVVDSRSGLGSPAAPWRPAENRTVTVAGRGGVPATGARSVVLNVTIVSPAASGYLTVSPSGLPRPTASNLNFVPGQIVAGQVTVPLGADGGVAVYLGSGKPADVVVDVQGWSRAGAVLASGAFEAVTPERLLDTRQDATPEYGFSAVPAGAIVTLDVARDVPTHAVSAVLLTVTATDTRRDGFVTVFPAGGAAPLASNLNFRAGDTVPDAVAVAVGPDGTVALRNGSPDTIELVVDAAGYWFDGSLGAVTGTVTGPAGQPLAGVQVAVGFSSSSDDDDLLERAAFDPAAVTDAAGRYTVDGLDASTAATLCVSTTHATPLVGAGGLAGGCPQRGTVVVRAGRVTTVDAGLVKAGIAVSGRLVGAGGEALAGVPVHLGSRGSSATQSEPVLTAADGTWRAPGVDPSAFVSGLCLDAIAPTGAAPQGYPGQCLYVQAGGTQVAAAGAAVSGRVTDAGGRPLAHVAVTWRVGGDPNGNGTRSMTGPDGSYRFLVDPGSQQEGVQVCFLARTWYQQPIVPSGGGSTTGYQDQCWKGLPVAYGTTGSYTPVPVTAGAAVTGVDAALAPAAAISGQVRGPGGSPVAGVHVVLYGGDDVALTYLTTLTGGDGRYRLAALRPGHYTVCFVPTLGSPVPPPTGLVAQCWHDLTPFTSEQVSLPSGRETTGIDADLNAGGTLAGRVTDSAGAPLAGAEVSVDGGQSTTTGADGRYRFDFLRALPTRIFVNADAATGGSSPAGYLGTCVGCDDDPLHRSPVQVVVGRTTTTDVALASASGIRVRVTDGAGGAVAGALVAVVAVGSNSGFYSDPTGADGTAVVGHLDAGRYSVCVGGTDGATGGSSAGGYLPGCYQPAFTVTVAVATGSTADATVPARLGAGVAGHLTDPSGRPVRGASVQVFGWTSPQDNALVSTGADGAFTARGLEAGSYSVCFSGGSVDGTTETLQATCWKDRPNTGGGTDHTPVTLTSGALTGGIDQVAPMA